MRAQILGLVQEHHDEAFAPRPFEPGETQLNFAGRVFDHEEVEHPVDASLDFWLTTGRYAKEFEKRFARYFGLRHAALVNSGSSANLVACAALASPTLGKRRLRPGDEVITGPPASPRRSTRSSRTAWSRRRSRTARARS